MKERKTYDPRDPSLLDATVERLIISSGRVTNSNQRRRGPSLGSSLGYLIAGQLATDFEWSKDRRWIDTADMLSLTVGESIIRGIGVLWWGDAYNVGGNQLPEPVS